MLVNCRVYLIIWTNKLFLNQDKIVTVFWMYGVHVSSSIEDNSNSCGYCIRSQFFGGMTSSSVPFSNSTSFVCVLDPLCCSVLYMYRIFLHRWKQIHSHAWRVMKMSFLSLKVLSLQLLLNIHYTIVKIIKTIVRKTRMIWAGVVDLLCAVFL